MSPEVLIVRHGDGYRVLHGHLHLASLMSRSNVVVVDASGEGKVKVVKTATGILIDKEDRLLPLVNENQELCAPHEIIFSGEYAENMMI